MATHTYTYNNTEVHYERVGAGPDVVLLHGFGEDRHVWAAQVTHLKSSFRLLVPDIPGSGDTLPLPAAEIDDLIIDIYAKIVNGILEQEGIRHCTVIGHSMGGYIALAFAEKFPEKLAALGLFHSTAFADSQERLEMRRKGVEFIKRNGAEAFLKQSIPNLFGREFTENHPGKISELINKSGNFSSEVLVQYYEAMMQRPDRTDVLKKCKKPVLFITGEEDKSVYLQDSLKQFHLPLISDVKIFKNVAHMGMWEMENESNQTLEKFLNYVVDG